MTSTSPGWSRGSLVCDVAEAAALISEARDWEELLPYPPEHSCGPVCEDCRVKLSRETRDGYKW